ncbi:MAG TPA: carbon monoxide dehydrogenase subunit G [Bellilinea sp.]
MKLEGEHVFNGPRGDVWEMFYDPAILASAVPGMDKLDVVAENEYEGVMNVRIGPVSGKFQGKLTLTDVVEPESLTLTVDGRGAPGYGKGVGKATFIQNPDGTTTLKYDGDMNIGGALASVGQRMIDSVAKSMIRSAFETLDKALEARLEAKKTGEEVNFTPPTTTEFAGSVAKDMVGGFTKVPELRLILYILPVVAILVILALVLSK